MIPTLYENYRRWSDGGSIFILSDLHFADAHCKAINELVRNNEAFKSEGQNGQGR